MKFLILLLSLICFIAHCDDVVFASIGDLHTNDYGSIHIVNNAVSKINNDSSIQFVIILGDISDAGSLHDLQIIKECLDKLNKPYYPVPGNHDIDAIGSQINYIEVFGYPNYSIENQYLKFILFNTNPGTNPFNSWLLAWVEKEINNTDKKIVICGHDPFMPGLSSYRHPYADNVIELFTDNVIASIAGHYHANSYIYDNGVYYTTTNCCSINRPNHDLSPEKGYRVYTYNSATNYITSEFVEVTQ